MTNRLAAEQSPYLLQHKENPVDWYPWGEEAFAKARAENKPIFLSVGYSTCHWCHVMEEESFEDDEVAEAMNDTFVAIKVDREERPDVDSLYMTVAQMINGQGGWPLTVLMTPDRKPFYATTYLPKHGRFGRMGMMDLIPRVKKLWREQRDELEGEAQKITEALQEASAAGSAGEELDVSILDAAYEQLADRFDSVHGGFGGAPKFPSPHNLLFLLRYAVRSGEDHALQMLETTLDAMRLGGIWDHVGYGFHRYATDRRWLLPHFEKMLYDQAMLAMAYAEAYQALQKPAYAATTRDILAYVLRDLRDPAGGFYSAEDADSEIAPGEYEEGAFYVWSIDEVREVLTDEEAQLLIDVYNLEPGGNYADEATQQKTGRNILYLDRPVSEIARARNMDEEVLRDRLAGVRKKLFRRRNERARPRLDDKVLTDWNGLVIAALAQAARVLDAPEYAEAAQEAVSFILGTMREDDGRLLHRYRNGDAAIRAHLDDYSFLIWGLIELYETTFEAKWLGEALDLTETLVEHYWDAERGGFFFTADDGEALLIRTKEFYDGAVPSGNSVALYNLIRLGRLAQRSDFEARAHELVNVASPQLKQQPSGFTGLLVGFDFALGPTQEVVIAGDPNADTTKDMLQKLHGVYSPYKVVLLRQTDREAPPITDYAPFTRTQRSTGGGATAYVCSNYQCEMPTTDANAVLKALRTLHS